MSDQYDDESYITAATNNPDKFLWYRFKNSNGNVEMHNMKDANIIVKHNKTSMTEVDLAIKKEITEAQQRLENAQIELTEAQKNIEEIEKKTLVIGASYDIYDSNKNLKCGMCKLIKKLEQRSSGGKGAKQRRKTKAQNKGAKQIIFTFQKCKNKKFYNAFKSQIISL